MEEILENIEELKKSIGKVENSEYQEIFNGITKVLLGLTNKVEEVIVNSESLEENISFLNSDLSNIQEELFEEVTIEDLCELEDEYMEIECKNCGKMLFAEESTIKSLGHIPCPFCHEKTK